MNPACRVGDSGPYATKIEETEPAMRDTGSEEVRGIWEPGEGVDRLGGRMCL